MSMAKSSTPKNCLGQTLSASQISAHLINYKDFYELFYQGFILRAILSETEEKPLKSSLENEYFTGRPIFIGLFCIFHE